MRPAPLLLALLATAAPAQTPASPDQATIRAHVTFLASDALRGREAGTPDFDVAAQYVVSRMIAAGLAPGAGADAWLQPVPLGAAIATARPALTLTRAGVAVPLVFATDFGAGPQLAESRTDIAGPAVFVGQGVVDPTGKRDDYRGLDVRGRIVVMMQSRPAGYAPAVAAHLGNARERARQAARRGATGVIFIAPLDSESFARAAESGWQTRRMAWLDAAGRPRDEGAPVLATLSAAGAEKLFAGSRLPLAAILAADRAGTPLPTGPLSGTLRLTATSRQERVASANVIGLLKGSDPKLANEYVVLTAHLDHLGVTKTGAGDRINNGAQDNAVGVALMLEVARMFATDATRPRRSILFVALTGEEKGLLGSDYLVAHPPVPAGSIVADVNLDMPVLLSPLLDVVAHGGDRSTLGPVVAAAAQANGLTVAPDWEPEQGRFARSDQYSFAIAGIPAVSLKAGPAGGSADLQRAFARTTYHTPADDLSQPIQWDAAPLFTRLNHDIVRRIADADARPAWNPGDFYGALARTYRTRP